MTSASPVLPRRKSLIVFVHGFNSDPSCWNPILEILKADGEMTAAFDWKCFSYDSKVTKGLFNLLYRIPDYSDITAKFDQFLSNNFTPTYDQLFLIGHSQGGLIIQSWLAYIVTANQAATRLKRVREVIMICTPTLGSEIALGLRKVVFSVLPDPQEATLRPLNKIVNDARVMVDNRIVQTSLRDESHWTVPILAIWAQNDNVVGAPSAQASFDNKLTLDGDHSSVLQMKGVTDDNYRQFKQTLLRPIGHRHVFEVDHYETSIAVQPLIGDAQTYIARRGDRNETKATDNFATIRRVAKMSEGNTCVDLFRFNYLTGPKGFIEAAFDQVGRDSDASPPVNEAPGDMRGRWLAGENDVIYDFRPEKGKTYAYDLRIWSGFDAGRRDVHFHFEGAIRIKEYVFTLDLSAYTSKGWSITRMPEVYVDPFGTAEHHIGEQRLPQNLRTPQSADPAAGKWSWIFYDFSGGIVDAVWDLAPPA